MEKLLQKKLSTFIVTAMLFSATAKAQIIYTDVNPDSTIYDGIPGPSPTPYYNLDLDNNASYDFTLTASYSGSLAIPVQYSSIVFASPLNGNAVKDTLVNTYNVPIPLPFNAVIDSNLLFHQSWQTSGNHALKSEHYNQNSGTTTYGLWENQSDYYLGLRLLQSGQTYYGWVRLRVVVSSSPSGGYAYFIVRDYAYNSIPNQPILAGQTVATGITETSFAASIHLYPNPATNHITIDLPKANEKVEVTIADITGKIIYKATGIDIQKIEVNTADFAKGIYVVQIQSADFIATQKLVIQK
jgi:hypothetical protein